MLHLFSVLRNQNLIYQHSVKMPVQELLYREKQGWRNFPVFYWEARFKIVWAKISHLKKKKIYKGIIGWKIQLMVKHNIRYIYWSKCSKIQDSCQGTIVKSCCQVVNLVVVYWLRLRGVYVGHSYRICIHL